jgi:hypothetical protein
MLVLFFLRCPVVATAAGVRTWPGKAISDLGLTCTVSGFSLTRCDVKWIQIQTSRKDLEWMGFVWTMHGLTIMVEVYIITHNIRLESPSAGTPPTESSEI